MVGLLGINRFLAAPLVAVLIAAGTFTSAQASSGAAPSLVQSCNTERGRPADRPVPAGQLVRRGIVGNIVSIDLEAGTMLVEMQFGTVEIAVPEEFDLTEELIGSRMAGLLEKEAKPVDVEPASGGGELEASSSGAEGETEGATESGSATGTEGETEGATDEPQEPIRTATATKIKIIPNQVSRFQEEVVVTSESDGSLGVVDEDGNEDTFEVTGEGGVQVVPEDTDESTDGTGDSTDGSGDATEGSDEATDGSDDATEGTDGTNEGTDGTTDGTDGTEASGLVVEQEVIEEGSDAVILLRCNSDHSKPEVRSALKAERITERLARFEAKLADRDAAKAERIASRLADHEARQEARLERTANNASGKGKDNANKALGKARGENQGQGGGNSGKSGTGNSGRGNSGGGNSGGGGGNSGGGGNPNN